jgi:replicative DNA helicase
LTGETPVYLPDKGVYQPIAQLIGRKDFRVLALNEATWQLEPATVTNAFATGRKYVYKMTTRLGRTIRATANHKFLTFDGWHRLDEMEEGLSRERALRVATAVQSQPLTLLAQSDIYWDEIASIEPDGEEEVYDLTVEKLHNFTAGDIITHNSIEQDADVVMFIYRDDVYNPDSERKNIADIIIAKHRNGPVGEVSLYFQPSQTRFHDLEDANTSTPEEQ